MKIIIILFISIQLFSSSLNNYQIQVLKRIYELATDFPNKYGETYEKTLCMIAMQESSLGLNKIGDISKRKSILKGSYGIFQFQLNTVRELSRKYKQLKWLQHKTDSWIINKLVRSDDFSIVCAVFNMKRISESKIAQRNWRRMITMWNGMPNGKITKYVNRVLRWKTLIYRTLKTKGLK